MEGKEYNEEDEEKKNSDSSKKENVDDSESDDFGLPEVENADDAYSDSDSGSDDSYGYSSDESYDSNKDEYSYSSDSDYESDYSSDQDDSGYYSDQDPGEYASKDPGPEEQRNYYIHGLDDDDRGGGSSAGWIIGIIIFVIVAAGFVWWFFLREPEKPVVQTPKPQPKPKVEQPVDTMPKVEETPMIEDEKPASGTVPGQVTQLTQPTGRYYVIIASFIDDDLAMDYGDKLAKSGVGSMILNPKTDRGFYRLALADFVGLKDAALEAERLKSTYGEGVWVIKY